MVTRHPGLDQTAGMGMYSGGYSVVDVSPAGDTQTAGDLGADSNPQYPRGCSLSVVGLL